MFIPPKSRTCSTSTKPWPVVIDDVGRQKATAGYSDGALVELLAAGDAAGEVAVRL
jgi:hypothetical protein